MGSAQIRVSLAQINPVVGDLDGNTDKLINFINKAKCAGSDIVILPELALCGYPPEDLLFRKSFSEDNLSALQKVLPSTEGICAVIGFAEPAGDGVFNAAALISNGRIEAVYHKIELPNYGVFDEKRYFKSGTEPLAFEVDGTIVAVTICEDIWVEGGRAELGIVKSGPEIVLNISASPFHAGKIRLRNNLVASLAKRTGAFVCYTNLLGGQDELVFDGGGIVAAPDGNLITSSARFTENLLTVDIPVNENKKKNCAGIPKISRSSDSEKRAVIKPAGLVVDLGETEEIFEALVLGTRDYIRKNRFKKAVLGLSGGIDSALTATIAVEAIGKDNVIGVTMPSEFTSEGTRSDAVKVAENLGIEIITVPISGILSEYLRFLQEPFGPGELGLEKENLQARIRGNILMALSNRFGWLVLTTGNKSEMAVGYCTLYGDMAGGFAVIKDVPKTVVYRLSEYINEKSGREIIPQSTIDRPPTAELRPDQKDEDSLPPYSVLDPIVHLYVEEDKSPYEIIAEGFDPETVHEVVKLIDWSEYKRRQAPPGVKITPKSFGRDRRLPITNRYRYKK